MSALETYHAAMLPWREAVDKIVPRMVIRSNMQPVDHSYGLVDILRVSEDADQGYENQGAAGLAGKEFTGLFTETVLGSANRFFTMAGYSGTTATDSIYTTLRTDNFSQQARLRLMRTSTP
jgi:hypothetical protein